MKNLRNFLLVTPDIFSSSSFGILLAPIFLFLTIEGIASVALISLFFIYFDTYLAQEYQFYFYISLLLLFFPLILIVKKKFFFNNNYLYLYLSCIWISLGLDWFNLKDYLYIFDNQHTYVDSRFAAYSLEPSFFAETFFPVFLLALNSNKIKIKTLYLVSFCAFFYFSLSRTLIQNLSIYCLSLLILYIFSNFNYKKVVLLSYSFFLFLIFIFLNNFNILDHFISYTLFELNSWRTVSNVSALVSSEIINFPLYFNYDAFANIAYSRFGMDGIEAIFSAFPYVSYSWGAFIAILWSFFILWHAMPERFNYNRVASIFALILIYFFFAPKWNFVDLYAILYLKNMSNSQ